MSSYDPEASRKAESNEFYSRTRMGRVMCKLCQVVCRDAANFLVHLEANKHKTSLARRQRRLRLAKLQVDQGGAIGGELGKRGRGDEGGNGGAASLMDVEHTASAVHGKPVYHVRLEPNPAVQTCKVWVEVQYPALDSELGRPPVAYRWLSTYEQSVEAPQPGVVYLLVACDGYETIALKFPSNIPRESSREKAQWDAKKKVYSLYFSLG